MEKKDFRKLYEDLVMSDWFKKVYHDKSLGECPFEIPELEESYDERIRKWLIDYFKSVSKSWIHRDISPEQIISYLEKQKEEEGYEAIPVESTLEYKLGFKAGKESEKQKERGPLTKEEEYTLHRIIEYLEDETCPSEWINLLHDIYCLPYEKQKEQKQEWSEERIFTSPRNV